LQAELLAADLHRLLGGGGGGERTALPLSGDLRKHLCGIMRAQDRLAELPASAGTLEVRAGLGREAVQVSVRRPCAEAIEVCAFVANWVAEGDLEREAAARLAFMLHARLRWVRLVWREGTRIEVAVAIPPDAFTAHVWGLARQAIGQATVSCRRVLRLVQSPPVAAEFLHAMNLMADFAVGARFRQAPGPKARM